MPEKDFNWMGEILKPGGIDFAAYREELLEAAKRDYPERGVMLRTAYLRHFRNTKDLKNVFRELNLEHRA